VLRVNPRDADALAWRGRLLLLDDDPEAAVQLLGEAASSPSASIDLLRLFGTACERTARDAQSADSFQQVIRRLTSRDDADARDDHAAFAGDWANVVRASLRVGRLDLARGFAHDAAVAWPADLDLRLLLARARLLAGHTDAAISGLEATLEEFDAAVEPRLLLAAVFEREGRTDTAERLLRDNAESANARMRVALAGLLGRSGRTDAMEAELAAVLSDTTDPGGAGLLIGGVLLSLDPPRIERAREAFERAAASAPHRRDAFVRLADLALVAAAADPEARAAARAAIDRAAEAGAAQGRIDYLEGKFALVVGDAPTAVARLERATAGGRESPASLYYLAKALRANGAGRDAQAPLDRAVVLAPGDATIRDEVDAVRIDLGVEAIAGKQFSRAVTLFSRAGSGDATALLVAAARSGLLEFELAARIARTHVTDHPDDRSGRHVLGAVLLARAAPVHVREAASVFAALAASDPGDVAALVGLGAARLAIDDAAGAETAFRAANELAPADSAIVRGVVDSLVAQGLARDAATFATRVAGERPGRPELQQLLGDVLLHAGDVDASAAAYMRAADARPTDVLPLLGAAAALVGGGQAEQARALLIERVEALAEPGRAWSALAELLLREGDLDAAEEALTHVRGGARGSANALLVRGELALARGDSEKALARFTSGVEQGARDPATLLRLAVLLSRAGQRRQAIDTYERVLSVAPDDVTAQNNLAQLLGAAPDDHDRALELARAARELAPTRPEVADTLGWLLVRTGDPAAALAPLREAAAALRDDARVHYHLGLAAARVGLSDEAAAHLERALAIDPLFPDAPTARRELDRLR